MKNNPIKKAHDSLNLMSGSGGDESYAAIELFRKMQQHCNFVAQLQIPDLNDPEKLREVIQNISYVLAITAQKNKSLTDAQKEAKGQHNKLRIENNNINQLKLRLESEIDKLKIELEEKVEELEKVCQEREEVIEDSKGKIARLYDIDFEPY